MHALFEASRPVWEIPFSDVSNSVLSVMPGESHKLFHDPLTGRTIRWEEDVYCPTCTVHGGRICAVYRAWGEDEQWRQGLAWSDDGVHFQRSEQPALHAAPGDALLKVIRKDDTLSVSYGDSCLVTGEDGAHYLLFNCLQHQVEQDQELAVASTTDMKTWTVHGRAFARVAAHDRDVIPEKAPWRLPHPTVVVRLEGDRLVAARVGGRYWMYLNCLSTLGAPCLCAATSHNLVDWEVLRCKDGHLVHPMPTRPQRFDSLYIDTAAAVLRHDGILLIYNGINDDPATNGDPRLMQYAHYPAQALFDGDDPTHLLARSETPFKGGDGELEREPRVFWDAPLYEAWSLVPWRGNLLLYWNHGFGRRSVGLWRGPIPETMR